MGQHNNERPRGDAPVTPQGEESPETGHGRVGSGAPVGADPSSDVGYRGTADQEAGPIFVDTPVGEHEYGRGR